MLAYKNKAHSKNGLKTSQSGFTLIELSIVLVIIGLIVGGVLVGQDLIKAAQIRAEVTQLERYNTAANTFRGKYNGLPGDLLNGANFFTSVAGQGTAAGMGNGDGLIQSISAAATTCATLNCIAGETQVFWYELNQSAMIPDATTAGVTYVYATTAITSSFIPNGKVPGSTISVNAANGINYWVLASQSGTLSSGVPGTNNAALSPTQAYQIDTKIDDGIPGTGTVISIVTGIPGAQGDGGGAAASYCSTGGTVSSSVAGTYNIAAAPNGVNCMLSVRTNF